MVKDQPVNLNVPRLQELADMKGLSAGGLADLTTKSSLNQTISRTGIQRILASDGENIAIWKVELLADVLNVHPENLIKGVMRNTKELVFNPVTQGIDLRKLFLGDVLHDLDMITEPSGREAQKASMDLLNLIEERSLIGGDKMQQMQVNFQVRDILETLALWGFGLYAARTMQVCPFEVEHVEIFPEEYRTEVDFTLVDENFIWDEAADYHFNGIDLCDVLLLKIDKSGKPNLIIEHDMDPAKLVKPEPFNYCLIENIARLDKGIALMSNNQRANLDMDDFTDLTAKDLYRQWKIEKEKRDAKNADKALF